MIGAGTGLAGPQLWICAPYPLASTTRRRSAVTWKRRQLLPLAVSGGFRRFRLLAGFRRARLKLALYWHRVSAAGRWNEDPIGCADAPAGRGILWRVRQVAHPRVRSLRSQPPTSADRRAGVGAIACSLRRQPRLLGRVARSSSISRPRGEPRCDRSERNPEAGLRYRRTGFDPPWVELGELGDASCVATCRWRSRESGDRARSLSGSELTKHCY
jgi:hypothetical protein